MPIDLPKDKWAGKIREVKFGATAAEGGTRSRSIVVGGDTTMPFLQYEAPAQHSPVIAVEIKSHTPEDWSPLLAEAWGEAMRDPAAWAKAAQDAGADAVVLGLTLEDTPEGAVNIVKSVLSASSLPLMVFGAGQADKDNELLVAVSEAMRGERLVLGICEEKNYRTIVATAMANGHLVTARTAMDVNLAKQLNILITDMGLPLDRLLVDPTTGALGYGIEYGYSSMERFHLAGLQGDGMTQFPMVVSVGAETWKTKESKVGSGVPAAWGDWKNRAILWETTTATALLEAGASILVLRHPESVRRMRLAVTELMTA
ncbi:MAG: acetyl-CoA decarbonylase/synthase complex subunit delta [Anaerolineaceae bacterium]|nr:acetyl-CoA decarbonylase/synthase complex subunit delta [Anaerolineaceae bacterium]